MVVLVVGIFLLLAYNFWATYRETRAEAEFTARSQAELIEARLDATLRRVDADLNRLAARVPGELLGPATGVTMRQALERDLERNRIAFPEVGGFRIADAAGKLLYVENEINIADRAYFAQIRDNPDAGTVFSDVVTSRLNGDRSVIAARAIRDDEGRFLGAVIVPLHLQYFARLFDSLKLGPHGSMSIRRTDDHSLVLIAPPALANLAPVSTVEHPLQAVLASGSRSGMLEFVSPADGVERIFAYRLLEYYPFYVMAGVAESDVLASWLQRVAVVGVVSLVLFSLIALVFFSLFRAQARELRVLSELEQHKEQLKTAQRIAQLGSWELDLQTRQVVCSEELQQIFEFEPYLPVRSYDDFVALVHPEDRAEIDETFRDAIRKRSLLLAKHRLQLPDGRIKYLLETGEAHYAEDGTPLRIQGTAQDITGQHDIESRMQLLASAFHYSGEAILISDRDNNIVTVNPAFTKLTGYEPDEVVGRNPRILSAGRTTNEEYQEMWRTISETGFWQGEIWDRRKDGGIYPKWMTVSVIRGSDGSIENHIAHFTDVSSERAAEAQLQHMAHHDVLTGLLNRLSLKGRLDQALAAARREGNKVALLFIDLDRFKVINDTLGHHVGDKLLIEVADRLRDSVRDSDVVARLGGDEFVIMLSGMEHSGSAAIIAEKLVRNIGDPYLIEGYDLYTTPSIGVALFPTDGEDGETLMKNADAAMYHAKAAGRNNFQFFDARMNDAALERLKIEHSLRQALARDEFCVHYQPILDTQSGKVVGLEALVRWQHPEMGMVPPGNFIGIAEETGLIQPIGEWVFWTACRQLAEFNEAGLRGLKMSINISAMQLRNGNLPVLAKGAIEAFNLEPATLIFEITESVAMHQPDETVRILDLLHDMGVGLAIDDFGTGYSSLSYLRMFPIDHLKIDRSFVMEIGEDQDSAAICDATIGLAHSLGLKLVAEGVETVTQSDYLRGKGCDMMQGYLFSRPQPAEQVLAYIRERN